MIGKIFIGPLRYWAMLIIVVGTLWLMGRQQAHISDFKLYLLALAGLSAGAVAWVVITFRRGERITRESLDEEA